MFHGNKYGMVPTTFACFIVNMENVFNLIASANTLNLIKE